MVYFRLLLSNNPAVAAVAIAEHIEVAFVASEEVLSEALEKSQGSAIRHQRVLRHASAQFREGVFTHLGMRRAASEFPRDFKPPWILLFRFHPPTRGPSVSHRNPASVPSRNGVD
jgi:hypothetical protein